MHVIMYRHQLCTFGFAAAGEQHLHGSTTCISRALLHCALLTLQECLREARRVESITGQVEDAQYFVVPTRQLEVRNMVLA